MESRIAQTASSMFSGNITNFLMSMEDKKTKKWVIDHADPAVRSILCAQVLGSDAVLFIDLFLYLEILFCIYCFLLLLLLLMFLCLFECVLTLDVAHKWFDFFAIPWCFL